MYVCHCRVVTDHQIRAAIQCGARDVCAIAEACGAGSRCGGCLPALRKLLEEHGLSCDGPTSARTLREQLVRRQSQAILSELVRRDHPDDDGAEAPVVRRQTIAAMFVANDRKEEFVTSVQIEYPR